MTPKSWSFSHGDSTPLGPETRPRVSDNSLHCRRHFRLFLDLFSESNSRGFVVGRDFSRVARPVGFRFVQDGVGDLPVPLLTFVSAWLFIWRTSSSTIWVHLLYSRVRFQVVWFSCPVPWHALDITSFPVSKHDYKMPYSSLAKPHAFCIFLLQSLKFHTELPKCQQ